MSQDGEEQGVAEEGSKDLRRGDVEKFPEGNGT